MKKIFLISLVIGGLFVVSGVIASVVKRSHRSTIIATSGALAPTKALSSSVLRAHGNYENHLRAPFMQDATITYLAVKSAKPTVLFARKVRISSDGSLIKYERTTFREKDSFLLDGQDLIHTTFQDGKRSNVKILKRNESAIIRLQLATFGLLPMLKRLSAPATELIDLGDTSRGHRFQATTSSGSWYFYVNSDGLIDRVKVGEINVNYSDFRKIEEMTLPFYQQVRKGDDLMYEIKFDVLKLNPQFPQGVFKVNLP